VYIYTTTLASSYSHICCWWIKICFRWRKHDINGRQTEQTLNTRHGQTCEPYEWRLDSDVDNYIDWEWCICIIWAGDQWRGWRIDLYSPTSSSCTQQQISIAINSLSLHFPGEPGLADVYWSKGWWRWRWQLDYWSYKSCKAIVKSSPPTNQHPVFFTGRMPFLSPNQQCQSTEGKYGYKLTCWIK